MHRPPASTSGHGEHAGRFVHGCIKSGRRWLALGILALAGCTSLPTIVPDLARSRTPSTAQKTAQNTALNTARPAAALVGARGPLTAAQSQAVLNRLKSRGVPTSIFDRHLALEEEIVGSPLTTGNEVTLLQDGPATYRAMFAAITAAQNHIHLETYILDDDEVGQRFASALIAKQAQGVQVHLIVDSAGTFDTPSTFFKTLTDSGIKLLEFNPINPLAARKEWALNQRDHRKLLVVDGKTAFLGGVNISSVYSGGSFKPKSKAKASSSTTSTAAVSRLAWRDTHVQLRGPVVAEFQKLFLAAWAQQKGPPLPALDYFPPPVVAGQQVVRAIGSSPEESFSLIYATLLSAIDNAETSIAITNAYFVPDPQLLTALQAAAQRGVDVKLILPSETDSWLTFHAGRGSYLALLQAGVKLYQRRGVILHSKTALVDGVWATVGSTNLDWRSFLHNHELNAVVLGTAFGSQLQTQFDKDLAESDNITLAQWQNRPLQWRLKEIFAKTWEYWL
ncbi:MAG: phospholipase D-like domain-containing protein [Burkholderiaceae bacterium]